MCIRDSYASEPEKIMEEAENRKELYEGLRRISERERVYLLYRFGFEDDMELSLIHILMMASWVFSTRIHSSFGLRTFFLFL